MRTRIVMLMLLLISTLGTAPAWGSTTPTEARAIAAAKNDHTAYTLPPDKLQKAVHISALYDTLYFVRDGWQMVVLFLVLQLGWAAKMRDVAQRLSRNRWAQGYTFLLLFTLATLLLGLPLAMFGHHESVKYGFSVQHWPSWFWDQTKSLLLSIGLGGLGVMLLFWIIRRSPRRWWLWLWFPTMAATLMGTYLTPLVIDPMFHTFEPLSQSNPALVAQLEKVAANGGIDIPPERMFLMRASEKTTELNAYVTGFGGSKRLVIWDTMAKAASPDEIAFVSGHEMGHYVLGHIVRGMLISFFGILLAFFVAFHLFQRLLRRFGLRWGVASQNDWAALAIMVLVMDVMLFFAQPVGNAFSRSMEHDADVFGQEVVHGVVADPQESGRQLFELLGENVYDDPNPSPFVEFWTDSHPSIPFRAAFARHYNPWASGEAPKYFPKP